MQEALLLNQARRRRCQPRFARRRHTRMLKVSRNPPAVHVLKFRLSNAREFLGGGAPWCHQGALLGRGR